MMREVLTRRLKEAQSDNPKFNTLPDLMLIDGGKGQLAVAVSVAAELGFELNMIGLAKQFELVYTPGKSDPLVLPRNSQALFLLAAHPRRGPPLLRHLPPDAARQERDHVRAGHHPRHRPHPPPRPAELLRQRRKAQSTPTSSRSPTPPP